MYVAKSLRKYVCASLNPNAHIHSSCLLLQLVEKAIAERSRAKRAPAEPVVLSEGGKRKRVHLESQESPTARIGDTGASQAPTSGMRLLRDVARVAKQFFVDFARSKAAMPLLVANLLLYDSQSLSHFVASHHWICDRPHVVWRLRKLSI